MPKQRRKLWGLFAYKPRWGLTIRGWLIVLSAIAALLVSFLLGLESFLAYSAPLDAKVLVVEGWITDKGIAGAMEEYQSNSYDLLITAGSPFGRGEYLSEYRDFANLSKATMVKLGFDPQKIQPIPTPKVERDRTLTSAATVKQWLDASPLNPQAINVYTTDVHSRRTWLLYKQVFEPDIAVGVISHPPLSYDPQAWWVSSEGFRKVTSEAIAYVYAKFL